MAEFRNRRAGKSHGPRRAGRCNPLAIGGVSTPSRGIVVPHLPSHRHRIGPATRIFRTAPVDGKEAATFCTRKGQRRSRAQRRACRGSDCTGYTSRSCTATQFNARLSSASAPHGRSAHCVHGDVTDHHDRMLHRLRKSRAHAHQSAPARAEPGSWYLCIFPTQTVRRRTCSRDERRSRRTLRTRMGQTCSFPTPPRS